MNYRALGKTGRQVSEIGFGAWGIGGAQNGAVAYGATDDQESLSALKHAFDLGVTFFDTSDFYGFGHSETLIGKAFQKCRDKIIIASKVGFVALPDIQDFSSKHILSAIDNSLKRLQTDYIDLYQLHSPDVGVLTDTLWNTLEHLRDCGKIKNIGISLRSPGDALTVLQDYPFDTIQVNYNLVDQRALDIGLLDLCLEKQIGVVIRTPLCFGFLTGKYTGQSRFGLSDHRKNWSEAQIERWAQAYQVFLLSLGETQDLTPAQIALKFCLSHDAVSTVIPGMLNKKQVKENVSVSGLEAWPVDVLEKIRETYASHSFFVKN